MNRHSKKNRLAVLLLALAICLTLSACDSGAAQAPETMEEIMEKAQENMEAAESISYEMTMNIGMAVEGMTLQMTMLGKGGTKLHVDELCAHSRCSCKRRKGVLVPALVHTAEIFLFILVVSALFEVALHFMGEDSLRSLILNDPWIGEAIAGLVGFIPNCAVSVSCAQLYLKGGMSAGALMAMSLTGSGVGLLVLFRTNRHWAANVMILAVLYVSGVVLGRFAGFLF